MRASLAQLEGPRGSWKLATMCFCVAHATPGALRCVEDSFGGVSWPGLAKPASMSTQGCCPSPQHMGCTWATDELTSSRCLDPVHRASLWEEVAQA